MKQHAALAACALLLAASWCDEVRPLDSLDGDSGALGDSESGVWVIKTRKFHSKQPKQPGQAGKATRAGNATTGCAPWPAPCEQHGSSVTPNEITDTDKLIQNATRMDSAKAASKLVQQEAEDRARAKAKAKAKADKAQQKPGEPRRAARNGALANYWETSPGYLGNHKLSLLTKADKNTCAEACLKTSLCQSFSLSSDGNCELSKIIKSKGKPGDWQNGWWKWTYFQKDLTLPLDCEVSSWSGFSACDKKCGGGEHLRFRKVKVKSRGKGQACPKLKQVAKCNTDACVLSDCKVSSWSPWGKCDKPCGAASRRVRTRDVLKEPSGGGKACGAVVENQICSNLPRCPDGDKDQECKAGSWGAWSKCSAECGTGSQQRERPIVQEGRGKGNECPELKQKRSCNIHKCKPVACVEGRWSQFSMCSASCGGGNQTRTREIKTHPKYGGASCGERVERRKCNTQGCVPESCLVSQWGPWSDCDDGGRYRQRNVKRPAKDGGAKCPPLHEKGECVEEAELEKPHATNSTHVKLAARKAEAKEKKRQEELATARRVEILKNEFEAEILSPKAAH